MKIAFHDNSLCLRGTTVVIYDWAYWTRHYLNVEPIIVEHDKLNKILDKYFTHEESFDFGDDDFDVDVMAGDDLAQNNDDDDEPYPTNFGF